MALSDFWGPVSSAVLHRSQRLGAWLLLLLIGLGLAVPAPLHAVPPSLAVNWLRLADRTSCTGPTDGSGRSWDTPLFDDSAWESFTPPDDRDTTRGNVSRYYRGSFTLSAPAPVWVFFDSDDGSEIFVNGNSIGSYGRGCPNDGCINRFDCGINYCIAPIAVDASKLVAGTNVISVHMWNGPIGKAKFNLWVLPSDPGTCQPCTLNCVGVVPTPTPTTTPTFGPTNTPTPPICPGAPAGTDCNDNLVCNGTDTCDGNGNCVHSGDPCATGPQCQRTCKEATGQCADAAGTACDDGDTCTFADHCDGNGVCIGTTSTGNYTVLAATSLASLGRTVLETDVTGTICAKDVRLQAFSWIDGDVVALRSTPSSSTSPAVWFKHANILGPHCATAGGWVKGQTQVMAGGICDSTGTSAAIGECLAAQCGAAKREAEWANLPVTPGYELGAVWLKRNQSLRIPAIGTFGPGTTVVDIPSIRLDSFTTLTFAGDANTGTVIVRVSGPMRLGRPSTIGLAADDGAWMPQQIIFIVDSPVTMHSFVTAFGTIVGKSTVKIGFSSIINGAVIGNQGVTTGAYPVMLHQGFRSW